MEQNDVIFLHLSFPISQKIKKHSCISYDGFCQELKGIVQETLDFW